MAIRTAVLPGLLWVFAATAAAADDPLQNLGAIEDLSLEALLGRTVTTGSRTETTARQSPAVITVITREEIEARGYRSLAEALRSVPGFYDIYDLVDHNVGVRGVGGGPRGAGNHLKVMIDGQPVAYRPTTGNFFGQELIPMAAVERIEILRGPASALYGANAFLGVINVITRSEGPSEVGGQIGQIANAHATGAGGVLASQEGTTRALVAVHRTVIDRSGLTLAKTSPSVVRGLLDPLETTKNDTSAPTSAIAKLSVGDVDGPVGQTTAWASLQILDAAHEFNTLLPMSHQTRVHLVNQTWRLSWAFQPVPQVTTNIHFAGFDSRPGKRDLVGLGRPDKALLRDVSASGLDWGLQVSVVPVEALSVVAGADMTDEVHDLQTYDTIYPVGTFDPITGLQTRQIGTIEPSDRSNRTRHLINAGVFGQVIWRLTDALSATVGGRFDRHNIYDVALSPRAGLVLAPLEQPWNVKLLYGSSFKAPSAEQLFTAAHRTFDIQGNAELNAQRARTLDLAGGYQIEGLGEIEANAYATQINGLVEYVQHDLNLFAENAVDEWSTGGEFALRVRPVDWLMFRSGVGVAKVFAQDVVDELTLLFGTEEVPTTFPVWQVHVLSEVRLPVLNLRLSPEVSFVGARAATQSNVLQSLGSYNDPYQLPSYAMFAFTAASTDLALFRDRPTRLVLRVDDVFDAAHSEPGFNGIDYPTLGRRTWLTLVQGF